MHSKAIIILVLVTGGFFVVRHVQVAQQSTSPVLVEAVATPHQGIFSEAQAFILPVSQATTYPIRNSDVEEPVIDAKAAGLYDVRAGKFLYASHIDDPLPIASITKLMTAVVVIENLIPDDVVTVTAEDLNLSGYGADLTKNEKISVKNLMNIMLVKSSNDAASALATHANSKGIDLVRVMNDKAKSLSMTNTHFVDPAGLDDNGHSSVHDLVRLMSYINRYPELLSILRKESATISSVDGKIVHNVRTTDQLLGELSNIIAGKTGYTDVAQGTLLLQVGLKEYDDSLISVVLGTKDRFGETKQLINWAKKGYLWK